MNSGKAKWQERTYSINKVCVDGDVTEDAKLTTETILKRLWHNPRCSKVVGRGTLENRPAAVGAYPAH